MKLTLVSDCRPSPPADPEPDLPVMAPGAEALLGENAGPHIEALLTVPVELQLLASLHLLPVLGQDEEGVRRHRVQRHVLCKQHDKTAFKRSPSSYGSAANQHWLEEMT